MARRTWLRATSVVALALLAGFGCQAGPRAALRTAPAPPVAAAAATGTLRVDLGAIAAAWGPRRRLATSRQPLVDAALDAVVTVRLLARGLGMSELTSEAVAISGTREDGDDLVIDLAVPEGRNRVFEVQGLNGHGEVCKHLRGLADVEAGQDVTVTIDAQADAAARVVDLLLAGDPLPATLQESLATGDLGAGLVGYIDRYTERVGTQNVYQGLNPLYFRADELAQLLRTDGLALLDPAQGLKTALTVSAGSNHVVTVQDAGGKGLTTATVELLSPYPQTLVAGNTGGTYAFSDVPPGRWAIAVTYDGQVTYGTLDAVDFDQSDPTTIAVPTASPPPPAANPYALYGPSAFGPGVSGDLLAGASVLGEPFGVEGSVDLALTITGQAGVDTTFALADTSGTDYRAWTHLSFQGRGVGGGVPLLVQLTSGGTAFGPSYPLPAGGLADGGWQPVTIPLDQLSVDAAQLGTADGIRFTASLGATFRLDDVRLVAQ